MMRPLHEIPSTPRLSPKSGGLGRNAVLLPLLARFVRRPLSDRVFGNRASCRGSRGNEANGFDGSAAGGVA